jgi:hypothetical protein
MGAYRRQSATNEEANALFCMARDGSQQATELLWEVTYPLFVKYSKSARIIGTLLLEVVNEAWIYFMKNYKPEVGNCPTSYIPWAVKAASGMLKKRDGWKWIDKKGEQRGWCIPYRESYEQKEELLNTLASKSEDQDLDILLDCLRRRPRLAEEFYEWLRTKL